MSIKVLLADDSDVMRVAIRNTLEEEPRIRIVGEACTFPEAVQMIEVFQPDVLILDLHLPEREGCTPAFVKSLLAGVVHVVAVSFSNNAEAKTFAESYGAVTLLDKMNLYNVLIPSIMNCLRVAKYNTASA